MLQYRVRILWHDGTETITFPFAYDKSEALVLHASQVGDAHGRPMEINAWPVDSHGFPTYLNRPGP